MLTRQLRKPIERRKNFNVGIKVEQRSLLSREEMAEEPRFQRRGQFGHIVEHRHASFLARWETDVVENE